MENLKVYLLEIALTAIGYFIISLSLISLSTAPSFRKNTLPSYREYPNIHKTLYQYQTSQLYSNFKSVVFTYYFLTRIFMISSYFLRNTLSSSIHPHTALSKVK